MIKSFKGKQVAIFGDLMLDKYIYGKVERISPEAPIPIIAVEKEFFVPGGAANVAANITSLGANAHLFGITGNDKSSDILLREAGKKCIDIEGIIKKKSVHTIQKIRIIAQNQQLLRMDYESSNYSDVKTNNFFINELSKIDKLSAIIISDYAKGTINEELIQNIKRFSSQKNIPIFVDPKPVNAELYYDVFLITPNLKEAESMCNMRLNSIEMIEKCGNMLQKRYNSNIIITRGAEGMSVFEKGMQSIHIPTKAKQVYDVSGAGDTVVAALCLSIVSGINFPDAINIANHAAGIKVSKIGTAAITYNELAESLGES